MSGLILLAVLIACSWGGALLVRFVGRVVPNPRWKNPAMVGVTLLLLTAPFVDEVIGMYQFNAQCNANGIESADVSMARGRRVIFVSDERMNVRGTLIPIKVSTNQIRNADNGDILFQYKDYFAKGGWLMRYTPISMGSATPMLFDGNGCGFDLKDQIFSKNNILQIN